MDTHIFCVCSTIPLAINAPSLCRHLRVNLCNYPHWGLKAEPWSFFIQFSVGSITCRALFIAGVVCVAELCAVLCPHTHLCVPAGQVGEYLYNIHISAFWAAHWAQHSPPSAAFVQFIMETYLSLLSCLSQRPTFDLLLGTCRTALVSRYHSQCVYQLFFSFSPFLLCVPFSLSHKSPARCLCVVPQRCGPGQEEPGLGEALGWRICEPVQLAV